jgi:hypothetical protein
MRSILILLAIAAVCVTTARAGWTSDSLVTGSPGVWRELYIPNNFHKVVFGTDGVGHLVWSGGPSNLPYPGVWYNRYNPGSGNRQGYWTADFGVAPYKKNVQVANSVPCIALDGDGRTIHVVWWRRQMGLTVVPDSLCYRRCTQDRKGNDKWDVTLYLYGAIYMSPPVVACVPNEPNHVLVCWRYCVPFGTGGYSMVTRFREYVNGAWTAVVLLDSSLSPQDNVSIAAAPNGDVFVAYPGYDEGTSGKQIFVKTRTNGVWGQPVNVTKSFSSLLCTFYTIEVNPITGNPHLVFERWTAVPNGAGEDTFHAVYHTYRNASGAWLTTPEVISEPRRRPFIGSQCAPTIAFVSNGAAHVVWRDSVPSTSYGIMYSYCSSEGGTWSTPEWLTSYYPNSCPFITVEEPAHTIRMVWKRHLSDNPYCDEIWWKSNYLGGGGGMGRPVALSLSSIELFPNPSKAGRVTVHYALPHTGPMTVTLFDVSGRAVRTQEVAASGVKGSVFIDVRGLSSGVYVARLVAGDLSVSKSLVVGR